jgi:hypothetical protein
MFAAEEAEVTAGMMEEKRGRGGEEEIVGGRARK